MLPAFAMVQSLMSATFARSVLAVSEIARTLDRKDETQAFLSYLQSSASLSNDASLVEQYFQSELYYDTKTKSKHSKDNALA